MTIRETAVVSILLLVAKWLAPTEWQTDIKNISTHISVWVGTKEG